MSCGRNLVGGFPEGADFYSAVDVDTEFGLGVQCAEARAGKIFTEGLLIFAKVYVVAVGNKPVRGGMEISISPNGDHFCIRFKINSRSGWKVIGICEILKGYDILGLDGGQGGVLVEGVREGDIFVQGEGVGSDGAGDVEDNEELVLLADIGGI
jgi:hypothetical protein